MRCQTPPGLGSWIRARRSPELRQACRVPVKAAVVGKEQGDTTDIGIGSLIRQSPAMRGIEKAVYGAEIVELFRRVKEAFDPLGILNPGVKIPSEEDRPFSSLKVGSSAVPLPEDIEAGLREIERSANYSVSRLELADGNQ